MSIAKKFGENVKAHRLKAGLSRRQLADAAGLDEAEIHNVERGVGMPDMDAPIKLSGALSTPLGELLEGCLEYVESSLPRELP